MEQPRICAALTTDDTEAMKSVEATVDLFEVRIDLIGDTWEKLAKKIRKPWIATNRLESEGGQWEGPEARRIERLLRAMDLGASYIDIEYQSKSLMNLVPVIKKRAKCIVSCHDFRTTPPYSVLKEIIKGEIRAGADICKLVTTAENYEDNLKMLNLITDFPEAEIVTFAMGAAGQTSRILSPIVGGAFTFGSIDEGKESAPGQVTVRQLIETWEKMGVNLL